MFLVALDIDHGAGEGLADPVGEQIDLEQIDDRSLIVLRSPRSGRHLLRKAIEVTDQEVLSALKRDLIDRESIVSNVKFMGLQEKLRTLVRASGLRMVGPNCMGVLNTDPQVSLNATFAPTPAPAGNVGMLSQSGALGRAMGHYGVHELPTARNCIELMLYGTGGTSLAQYHDMR